MISDILFWISRVLMTFIYLLIFQELFGTLKSYSRLEITESVTCTQGMSLGICNIFLMISLLYQESRLEMIQFFFKLEKTQLGSFRST